MRGPHVHGLSDRFHLHLRLARTGNDFVLCAGQFYEEESGDARSGSEISRLKRALDGILCLRNHMAFWSNRRNEPATHRGRIDQSLD